MPEITKRQEDIYNKHLSISRQIKNKPFKYKKDFSSIDIKTANILSRIEMLFNKFPNIEADTYFKAPYILWKDVEYFPLEYFSTQAAIRAFTLYKKQLLESDIDSDESINEIKNSLMFICKFCVSNKIQLDKYINHKQGVVFSWMKHIRSGLITPYIVFGFSNIDNIFFNIPEDEADLMLGVFKEKYYIYKGNYNKSKIAKPTVNEGFKRIKKWITEHLSGEK